MVGWSARRVASQLEVHAHEVSPSPGSGQVLPGPVYLVRLAVRHV